MTVFEIATLFITIFMGLSVLAGIMMSRKLMKIQVEFSDYLIEWASEVRNAQNELVDIIESNKDEVKP